MSRLSLKQCKTELTKNERQLHERILNLRNKLFAHSDEEFIRFSSTVLTTALPDDRGDMHIPLFQFNEGLKFSSRRKIDEVIGLIRKLMHGLMIQMFDEAQVNPEKYDWKDK
jgi:hypothetical protein